MSVLPGCFRGINQPSEHEPNHDELHHTFATAHLILIILAHATGAFLWSTPLQYPPRYGFYGPTVANGSIYIDSGDGRLYAFNAMTGAPLWTVPGVGSHIYSAPAVTDRMVYVITDSKLQAFNATTGASLWVTDTTGNVGKLAVAYGRVYANVGTPQQLLSSRPSMPQLVPTFGHLHLFNR